MTTYTAAAALKVKLSKDFKEVHVDKPIRRVMFEDMGNCEVKPVAQWHGNEGVSISIVEVIFNVDTVHLVVAHIADSYAKIYRGISDIDLPLLNLVTGLNIVAKMDTRWIPLYNKGSRELIYGIDGRDITFFDGTILECLMGDMETLYPGNRSKDYSFGLTQPKRPQQSMFERQQDCGFFGKGKPSETNQLKTTVRELRNELEVMSNYVNENVKTEYVGITLQRLGEDPLECKQYDPIDGPDDTSKLFLIVEPNLTYGDAYVRLGDSWFVCCDDTSTVLDKWFRMLLNSERGLETIRHLNRMQIDGTLFHLIDAKEHREIIAAHRMHKWAVHSKGSITTHRHGTGYAMVKGFRREYWFKFEAKKYDFKDVTEEVVRRECMPKVSAYAHTVPSTPKYDPATLEVAGKAVRATIVQVDKDKLTYRRDNQLAIGRDFSIEIITEHSALKRILASEDVVTVYRFRLTNGLSVFVQHDDEAHAHVLKLTEGQYDQMCRLKNRKASGTLTAHCIRIAKEFNL